MSTPDAVTGAARALWQLERHTLEITNCLRDVVRCGALVGGPTREDEADRRDAIEEMRPAWSEWPSAWRAAMTAADEVATLMDDPAAPAPQTWSAHLRLDLMALRRPLAHLLDRLGDRGGAHLVVGMARRNPELLDELERAAERLGLRREELLSVGPAAAPPPAGASDDSGPEPSLSIPENNAIRDLPSRGETSETATRRVRPRLTVTVQSLIATLDGTDHRLDSQKQAAALAKIVEANGGWVAGPSLSGGKVDRGLARAMGGLPPAISQCIEAKRGEGRRLRQEFIHHAES